MPLKKKLKFSGAKIFRKKGNIFGIGITGTPKLKLLMGIRDYLTKMRRSEAKKPLFITTPNPEQALFAKKDTRFKDILQKSDIAICDGVGLLASYEYNYKFKSQKSKVKNGSGSPLGNNDKILFPINFYTRIIRFTNAYLSVIRTGKSSDGIRIIKGRDFFLDLMDLANNKKGKVFLLGSTRKVLERATLKLSKKYPAVRFKTYHGAKLDSKAVPLTDKEIRRDEKTLRLINRFQPDMLFVAFGAPKQEKWVYRNIEKLNSSLIMVVGSTFNYIAGTRKSVPLYIEKLGLEWLWRLLTGSQNLKRIYNAVIKFPTLVLKES